VLIPVYGQKQIESEEPFSVSLDGDTWSVHGSLPKGLNLGGVAEVEISKSKGCILHMIHGK
jgi:NTF2 fold immunity protein of polymorphic toxin system component